MRRLLIVAVACWLPVTAARATVEANAPPVASTQGPTPQTRYDMARRAMQQGKFALAAEGFRAVADAEDAPLALRAQALLASGLMHENNRQYEEAAQVYREVPRRFADTDFARRAEAALQSLEAGGAQRGIEFRRRQDAAWDELFPAQAEAARGEWASARPKLKRATGRLRDILRDFRDHPKARDVAIALGNAYMLMGEFRAAQGAYAQAKAIAEEQAGAQGGGTGLASILLDAQERWAEAGRAWRRLWITRLSWVLVLLIAVAMLSLRPWRAADAGTLRLAARLIASTMLLSVVAALGSYVVRTYVDEHSPVEDRAAGLLVALPGATAVIATLGFALGLRGTVRWSDTRIATVAAVASALAAIAVAAIIINAFALFPVLDSDL